MNIRKILGIDFINGKPKAKTIMKIKKPSRLRNLFKKKIRSSLEWLIGQKLIQYLKSQGNDAFIGISLLGLGFVLQIIGNLIQNPLF